MSGAGQTAWLQKKGMIETRIQDKKERNKLAFSILGMPGCWPPTLFMQMLDGNKSLHQLRKGGGYGAPALYGFV